MPLVTPFGRPSGSMPRARARPAGAMVAVLRRPAAVPKAIARGARVPALAADGWYDSVANPRAFDLMQSKLESGRLIEFEVKDGSGEKRGHVAAEIIGQRITEQMGLSLLLISPLAAQDPAVRDWMRVSLTAPAGIVLCRGRASHTELGEERYHIQKVERLRILPQCEAQRGWARAQLATDGAPAQLLPRDLEAGRMKRQAQVTSLCCLLQKALRHGESPRWMQWTSCDMRPWEQLQSLMVPSLEALLAVESLRCLVSSWGLLRLATSRR